MQGKVTKKEGRKGGDRRECFYLLCTPPNGHMVGIYTGTIQEPIAPLDLTCEWQDPKYLDHLLLPSSAHEKEAGFEV